MGEEAGIAQIPEGILDLVQLKQSLYTKYLNNPTKENWDVYMAAYEAAMAVLGGYK